MSFYISLSEEAALLRAVSLPSGIQLIVETAERVISTQLPKLPSEALLEILADDDDSQGMTTCIALLSLVTRQDATRALLASLRKSGLEGEVSNSPTTRRRPTREAETITSLTACNRRVRRVTVRLLAYRLSCEANLRERWEELGFLRCLMRMLRDGDANDQTEACNALTRMTDVLTLPEDAALDIGGDVTLRLLQLLDVNKHLVQSMALTMQVFSDSKEQAEGSSRAQVPFEQRIGELDAKINEDELTGACDPEDLLRLEELKAELEARRKEVTNANEVHSEARMRFTEQTRLLVENHTHAQATMVVLALLVHSSAKARGHVVKRLPVNALVDLFEDPLNLSLQWSTTRLLAFVAFHDRRGQESVVGSGFMDHLLTFVKHASRWVDPCSAASSCAVSSVTSDGSTTQHSYIQPTSGSSPLGHQPGSGPSMLPRDVWSIEAAQQRVSFCAAGLRFDPCTRCLSNVVEALYVCTHGSKAASRHVCQSGALRPSLYLGYSSGGAKDSSTCSSSRASNVYDNMQRDAGSTQGQRYAQDACAYCAFSHPPAHDSYPPKLYRGLWGSVALGQPNPVDIVANVLSMDEGSHLDFLDVNGGLEQLVDVVRARSNPAYVHGALTALGSLLLPSPYPADIYPGRAQSHNHLSLESLGPFYCEVREQLLALGFVQALMDVILCAGQEDTELRDSACGPSQCAVIVAAMRCLGRMCLSCPAARDVVLTCIPTSPLVMHLPNAWDDVLDYLLYGCEAAQQPDRAGGRQWDGAIRAEAAAALSSVALNHKALQAKLRAQKHILVPTLLEYVSQGNDPQLTAQACRLVATVVQDSREMKEATCRMGLLQSMLQLMESPRSSLVIFACEAIQECVRAVRKAASSFTALRTWESGRSIRRLLGAACVPGGATTHAAVLRLLSSILELSNENRKQAFDCGITALVCKHALSQDRQLQQAAVNALEALMRRNAANLKEVTSTGGIEILLLIGRLGHASTRRAALLQASLLGKQCPDAKQRLLSANGLNTILDLIAAAPCDRDAARSAMQVLVALLDDAGVRARASRSGYAVRVLVSIIVADEVDVLLARDACSCLSKLSAESNEVREELVGNAILLNALQSLGSTESVELCRAATVVWASLMRSRVYGSTCCNQVGMPDLADGLVASCTVPTWVEE